MFLKFLNNLNLYEQRIGKYGCCFLCIWVKEESTIQIECEDYFTCGSESKKWRSNGCFANCYKEREEDIICGFEKTNHSDYVFKKYFLHLGLIHNAIEIFNFAGFAWPGDD